MRKRFSVRGLISLSVFWSFLVEAVSGLVLYIKPQGRISRWTHWKLLGMNHSDWVDIHTIFGYVFLIFAVLHIVNNWKSIRFYIRRKIKTGIELRREMKVSAAVCLILIAGTVMNWAPFQGIMNLGDMIKESWPGAASTPIASHAERMSFAEFAEESEISLETALSKMKKSGYEIKDPSIRIEEVTKKYGLAPIDIHNIITEKINVQRRRDENIQG